MRNSCSAVTFRVSDLVCRFHLIRRCSSTGGSANDADSTRRRVQSVWSGSRRSPTAGTAASAPMSTPSPSAATSRAMSFALHGSLATSASVVNRFAPRLVPGTASSASETALPAEVRWAACERPDFCLQYVVPEAWQLHESVRENHVAIQCRPSDGVGTSHGIVLNCFAYHRKVQEPSTVRLLDTFLRRFSQVVQPGSLKQLSVATRSSEAAAAPPEGHSDVLESGNGVGAPGDPGALASLVASRVAGTVAVVEFFPAPGAPLSRGLCRAFYSANMRYHYVLLAAVPADDWLASIGYMLHVMMSATDSRASRGARNF